VLNGNSVCATSIPHQIFHNSLTIPLQFPTVTLQPLTLPNPLNSKSFSPTPTTLSPTPTDTLSYTSHQNRTKPILQSTHSHPHFNPSHHPSKPSFHPQNTPLKSTLQQSFLSSHNQQINPKTLSQHPEFIPNSPYLHHSRQPNYNPILTQKSSEKHQKFTQISR
jgi:hypothetical protein